MGQVILGLFMVVGGVLIVMYTEWLINNFGRIAWFEEKLGTDGGSRLGYKLLGILAIFIGIIFMTGSGSGFMGWALSPLIRTQN